MQKRSNEAWVKALQGDFGETIQRAAYEDLSKKILWVCNNFLQETQKPGMWNLTSEQKQEMAKEFTQDILLKIYEKEIYATYENRQDVSFTSFIAKITINHIYDKVIRPKIYDIEIHPNTLNDEPSGYSTSAEHNAFQNYVCREILICLRKLPIRQRKAFLWRVCKSFTTETAKEYLNAPSNQTIYSLIKKAKSNIKICMEKRGWDFGDIRQIFGF